MWTYEWKRKGGGRREATVSYVEFRCKAERSSVSHFWETQRTCLCSTHVEDTKHGLQVNSKKHAYTHILLWPHIDFLCAVFLHSRNCEVRGSVLALISRPTQNPLTKSLQLSPKFDCLVFLKFDKCFMHCNFIQTSMQTLSQKWITKHQWLVHSLYGQKYWHTPSLEEKITAFKWLHLKSHQKCSAGIRTCLSADQSSSSTLTESSFLFDPCLIHRDTVMLE